MQQPVASSSRYHHHPNPNPHHRPRKMDPYYDDDELVPLSPRSRPTHLLPLHHLPHQPFPPQMQLQPMQMSYQVPFNFHPDPHYHPGSIQNQPGQNPLHAQYRFYTPYPIIYASAPLPKPKSVPKPTAVSVDEKDDDGYPVHQCSHCDKIYKGKHGRSIWRRHLQDKHGIPLSMQVRRSRWDADPNRPANGEEKRQRMLESKRRWAAKKRAERRMAKHSPDDEDEEFDEEQEREWQKHVQLEEAAANASASGSRAPKMARTNSNASRSLRGSTMARTASNTSTMSTAGPDVALSGHAPYEHERSTSLQQLAQLQAQSQPRSQSPVMEAVQADHFALSSTPAPTAEAAASLLIMQSSPAHVSILPKTQQKQQVQMQTLDPPIDLANGNQSKDLFVSAGVRGSSPICSPATHRKQPSSDSDEATKPQARYVVQRVDTTPTPLRRVFGRQSALKCKVSCSDDDPFNPPGLASSSASRDAPSSSTRTRDSPMTPMTPNVLTSNTRIMNAHSRARPPPPPVWAKESSSTTATLAATPGKLFAGATPLRYQSSPHWQLSSPNGLSLTHRLGLAPSAAILPETPGGWAEMLSGGGGGTPDHRRGVKRQPPMSAERNRWSDE